MLSDPLMNPFMRNVKTIIMPNGDSVAEIYADRHNPDGARLIMAIWGTGIANVSLGSPALFSWRALGERLTGTYYVDIDTPRPEELAGWEFIWRAPEARTRHSCSGHGPKDAYNKPPVMLL